VAHGEFDGEALELRFSAGNENERSARKVDGGSMSAEAYPLYWPEGWKRTAYRKKSAFKVAGFGRARDLLLAEIRRMGGSSVILSSNIALRQDGLPYANMAQPKDPGIAVYFLYKKRQMSFACDVYYKVEENAYAIAKTIEALRGIERWGASDMMERAFSGFKALSASNARAWWDVLECRPDATRDIVESQYRVRARSAHPDAGGSNDAMAELNEARQTALKALAS
jgi:hypothetical protein